MHKNNNLIITEPLEADEKVFIEKKYKRLSKTYMMVMNKMLVACGIIPLLLSLFYFIFSDSKELYVKVFIVGITYMLCFFVFIATIYYFYSLYNPYKDYKYKTKTIERCIVNEKKYMGLNNTYHFYLNSKVKYTIEIDSTYFECMQIGDEINIEYSTYDKELLGYY